MAAAGHVPWPRRRQQLWPDVAHSVFAFWTGPQRTFSHWYINFQEPLRRIPAGFETFDQELDLIVRPDGSYQWKDVDEFEQLVRAGRFPPEEAAAIRDEAGRVTAALDRGERWWNESWANWKADAGEAGMTDARS